MLKGIALIIVAMLFSQAALAKECWTLTGLRGQMAASTQKYAFAPDGFSKPIVLCFNGNGTGSVTGEKTRFAKFGNSTLIGWATDRGIELVETYQIDRPNETVLFTKSRIGTATVIPNGPDVVAAFVGRAQMLKDDRPGR